MKRKQNRDSKQREIEQKLISMQVNAINAQLDPHFVFNAISAIGTEVQQQNSEKAYTYFIKVSHLLRNSLKNADKITRTLKEELSFVENYLSLQKFRFDNRFDYIINVPPEMDMSRIIPKMCIQIFVENALKHGIEHLLSDGILTVTIWSDTRGFNAIIQDNGVGRAKSKQYNAHSTGVGLKVFTDFFAIMNKYNSKKAGFTIEDLLLDNGESGGTKVSLFIPEGYQFESL
jgi:LytS/YehU family sensor histidine kinase